MSSCGEAQVEAGGPEDGWVGLNGVIPPWNDGGQEAQRGEDGQSGRGLSSREGEEEDEDGDAGGRLSGGELRMGQARPSNEGDDSKGHCPEDEKKRVSTNKAQ